MSAGWFPLNQGNKPFVEYVSDAEWYNVNTASIRDQKVDIDEEHTQDIFISSMSHRDEIRNIVAVKRHSAHAYIAN